MDFLILKLDPDTREELYADIHPNLIDFILLEALTLVGKEFTTNPDVLADALLDEYYHLNDPEMDLQNAIEGILDSMTEIDKEAGIDTTAETYNHDENHPFISDKLILAIASISIANNVGEVVHLYNVTTNEKFVKGIQVKGTHLGNVATLSLTPIV